MWGFEDSGPEPGVKLGRGEVRLEQGRVRLDFNAGERVTVEGPATFELVAGDRISLKSGSLVASVAPQGRGFTVIMPNGAIIDLGTEFAASVGPDGENRVKVLKGAVMASSTNGQGHTSWEKVLVGGDEFSIIKGAPLAREAPRNEYPEPLTTAIQPLRLSNSYAQVAMDSNPVGYWRCDAVDALGSVKDETGTVPLALGRVAEIQESVECGDGFLVPAPLGRRGFAVSSDSFGGLNTPNGCSLEFWAHSDSVGWQTLGGLILDGPRPANLLPKHARHSPHLILVERAGASGTKQHHVHPNFAVRSLYRTPAVYRGGVNTYSSTSHLIHGWHHIIVVNSQGSFRIYVDGEISGESQAPEIFDAERYHLLLGRLYILDDEIDARPWSGAIDEVALYDHALSAEEIREHHRAASRETR